MAAHIELRSQDELSDRAKRYRDLFSKCEVCPRRCRVNRRDEFSGAVSLALQAGLTRFNGLDSLPTLRLV